MLSYEFRGHQRRQLGSDAVESKEGTFAALIQELMSPPRPAPRVWCGGGIASGFVILQFTVKVYPFLPLIGLCTHCAPGTPVVYRSRDRCACAFVEWLDRRAGGGRARGLRLGAIWRRRRQPPTVRRCRRQGPQGDPVLLQLRGSSGGGEGGETTRGRLQ